MAFHFNQISFWHNSFAFFLFLQNDQFWCKISFKEGRIKSFEHLYFFCFFCFGQTGVAKCALERGFYVRKFPVPVPDGVRKNMQSSCKWFLCVVFLSSISIWKNYLKQNQVHEVWAKKNNFYFNKKKGKKTSSKRFCFLFLSQNLV